MLRWDPELDQLEAANLRHMTCAALFVRQETQTRQMCQEPQPQEKPRNQERQTKQTPELSHVMTYRPR